jgi:Ca2+-binding EF-hand superfamily protein
VLGSLKTLFEEADKDGEGSLDTEELTDCLHKYYKGNKQGKPRKKVAQEVTEAMRVYDVDGSGSLEARILHHHRTSLLLTESVPCSFTSSSPWLCGVRNSTSW